MINIPGYETQQVLYKSKRCTIARVIRLKDQKTFVMKALSEKAMTPSEMQKLRHEFEIGQQFNSPSIIKYIELYASTQHLAILQEGGDMISLEKAIPETGFELAEFLNIAIQMVQALGDVHQKNITHKDIKPANFIFDPKTHFVKMIDFGSASNLKEEEIQPMKSIHKLEGTLAYISPEQTGRMNRTIDYRTDFYSLGISFYQLLSGQLPFAKKGAMEFIHCHLAQEAAPLHKVKSTVPEIISNIVSILMMKNAGDRYQSTQGILWDLRTCQQQLVNNNAITVFQLRLYDFSEKFQISQKLYGRENEIETLLTTFQRVSNGKPEVLLVAGYSGIGKTVLINEIQNPITLKNGLFLAGKFDQLSRSIAYSAIAQAFQGLVKQLLSESEKNRQIWREKLLSALGSNGQLVIEVIPEVEHIIGKQPPVPTIGPIEARNRFNNVFQNFITVFTQKEYPLVLFLDDLQWADTASLELIKLFITNPETQYFLLIGAYRDNEVNESHPAILTLEAIKKMQVPLQQMSLTSLDIMAVKRWIADSLQYSLEEVSPLAEVVYQKTQGNPFFVKMFLRALYDEKLLVLSEQRRWQWDLAKIQQRAATANVVEFMVSRIQQLEPSTQMVLAIASCLGHRFSIERLQIATRKDQEMLCSDLQAIFNAGLAYSVEKTIHFTHDRVQEAAYSLTILPAKEKKLIHLWVGRQLLQRNINRDQPENVFEIIEHLNRSIDFIEAIDERIALAKLNLRASQKAKNAVAYAAGINYIQAGLSCLNKNTLWSTHYHLAFSLYHEKAELEHSASQFEQAESTMRLLLVHAESAIEKANIYHLLIQQKSLLTQNEEAIQLGKTALALLGMELPGTKDALTQRFEQEKIEIKKSLDIQGINAILAKPDIGDPHKIAILKLLLSLLATTYVSDRPLYNVVTATAVQLSLQYGPIAGTPLSFAFYGSILCEQPETAQLGYQFGQLALKLSEKYNDLTQTCKVLLTLSILINPWFQTLESSLAMNNDAFQAGIDSGELQYAGYSRFYIATLLFFRGDPLPDVLAESNKLLEFLTKMKHQFSIDVVHCVQAVVNDLMGQKTNTVVQAAYLSDLKQRGNDHALCHHAILQAQKFYLYGRYHEAHQASLEAEAIIEYLSGHYAVAVHKFYYALTLAALCLTVSDSEKQTYYLQLINHQRILKAWTQNCPENFQVKYLLVSAEIAHLDHRPWEAGQLYDQAIEAAQSHDHPPELAIAYELACKFWLAENRKTIAQVYLNNAYLAYQRWGAKRKLEQLKKQYADLLTVSSTVEVAGSTFGMTTININSVLLDMQNVIKASQMISSNIELDKLLFNNLKIIIETAGAQKGALLLNHKGQLSVEAECNTSGEITVLQAMPLAAWEGAHSVVEYVKNTGQLVLLGCATEDRQFGVDPYIHKNQIKSLLCIAITLQDKLKGILYIENNLANFVFTQSRVAVLSILTNQMAISLENAQLIKEKMEALNKITQEQRQRAEDAEKNRERLTNYIDMFTHGLRNPLTGVQGSNSFIQKDVNDIQSALKEVAQNPFAAEEKIINYLSDITEQTEAIAECIHHSTVITDDVLDLSRIEANSKKLDLQPCRVQNVLSSIAKMFRAKIKEKGLEFILQAPEEVLLAKADINCLEQVLTNLITNAIKFTKQGHITLSLAVQEVAANEMVLEFKVEDTGIGLKEEEKEHLFNRFEQANRQVRHEYGGSGLGLYISKQLVNLMGGEITVASEKGKGSTFTFTARCTQLSPEERQQLTQSVSKEEKSETLSLEADVFQNVLIVEDNLINQRILAKYLAAKGHQYQIANNGIEALEKCRDTRFDAILMDIEMPEMNGLEATKQIRQEEAVLNSVATPIIGLSGNARVEQKEEALAAGMNAYLIKPYQANAIYHML